MRIQKLILPALIVAATLSFSSLLQAQITGFGGSSETGWTSNNGGGPAASVTGSGDIGDALTITTADNSADNSYFFGTPQPITTQGWTSTFTYTLTGGSVPPADGMTFTIENDPRGAAALGVGGGRLGYGGPYPDPPSGSLVNGTNGIVQSEAFLLNVYSGDGGTGIDQFLNAGTRSVASSRNFTSIAPVDPTLVNDPITVTLSYDGAGTLSATLTQDTTNTFTKTFNLPSYQQVLGGGNSFLVGFTGGTGGLNAAQTISNFTFTPNGSQVAPSVNIIRPNDTVVGVNAVPGAGTAANVSGDGAAYHALDGNVESKYLNFNQVTEGFSGIVVTPSIGRTVATELGLTSANDSPDRDPATYEVWGTNDDNLNDISPALNPTGWQTFYSLISAGAVPTFADRLTEQDIFFPNSTAYSSYLIDFPTITNSTGTANSMQIADIQLSGSIAVPEPASLLLAALGGLGLLFFGRRRRAA